MKAKKIATIVTQELMKGGRWHCACPFCDSKNVESNEGYVATNHHFQFTKCLDCEETFVYEWMDGIASGGYCWYTKDKRAIKGVSTCYEHLTYTCNVCEGDVTRYRTNLDGTPYTKSFISYKFGDEGGPRAEHMTFWSCKRCGQEARTE
jgi:hypothetical protein